MPNAFPPSINTMTNESGVMSGGHARAQKHSPIAQGTSGSAFHAASTGPLTADTSTITIASATPIVTTGAPFDFRSIHN
jgi:hypothetical protein